MPVYEPLIPGPAGTAGQPGVAGLPGDDGEEGQPGPPGPTGTAGAAGSTGAPGPSGPAVFLVGEDGEVGEPGPPGLTGAQGTAGQAGAQGPTGPAVFLVGEDGEEGAAGPPGVAGVAGAAGTTGAQGPMGPAVFLEADFIEGDMGPPGPAGPAGAGGAAVKVVELDFLGPSTMREQFTVSDAAVTTASHIMAKLSAESSATTTDAAPFRAATSGTYTSLSGVVNATAPTVVAGDLVVVAIRQPQETYIDAPVGFSLIALVRQPTPANKLWVFAKAATSSEPTTYVFTLGGGGSGAWIALTFQAAAKCSRLQSGNSGNSTVQSYGPIQTVQANEHLLVVISSDVAVTGDWTVDPVGLTRRTVVLGATQNLGAWSGIIAAPGSQSGSATHEADEFASLALVLSYDKLDDDEAEWEPMTVNAEGIASGSFVLAAEAQDGPVDGRYKFNYVVG